MANPKRLVSRSLIANALSPELSEARQKEIDQHSSLRRASMLAVHACAIKSPKLTAALMGMKYQKWKADYIGSGFEFTVFRTSEDEVLKIAHNTIMLSAGEKEAYAERRRSQHAVMARWLGEFALPQSVEVAPLPFLPSRSAVQVRQPYREITDPELFQRDIPEIEPVKVDDIRIDHPGSDDQLLDFIERGRSLYGAKELLPDTNGSANFVLSDEHFIIVDGTPIGTEYSHIQRIILGQLDALELAVS